MIRLKCTRIEARTRKEGEDYLAKPVVLATRTGLKSCDEAERLVGSEGFEPPTSSV